MYKRTRFSWSFCQRPRLAFKMLIKVLLPLLVLTTVSGQMDTSMETTSMEETTTIMPDTTTEKMCMDRFESCANIHPKDVDNFCTFDFAREACERRCGVCKPRCEDMSEDCSSKQDMCQKDVSVAKMCPETCGLCVCEDKWASCSRFHCKDSIGARNCRKTCNFCGVCETYNSPPCQNPTRAQCRTGFYHFRCFDVCAKCGMYL